LVTSNGSSKDTLSKHTSSNHSLVKELNFKLNSENENKDCFSKNNTNTNESSFSITKIKNNESTTATYAPITSYQNTHNNNVISDKSINENKSKKDLIGYVSNKNDFNNVTNNTSDIKFYIKKKISNSFEPKLLNETENLKLNENIERLKSTSFPSENQKIQPNQQSVSILKNDSTEKQLLVKILRVANLSGKLTF
jgi:hypothetical protein